MPLDDHISIAADAEVSNAEVVRRGWWWQSSSRWSLWLSLALSIGWWLLFAFNRQTWDLVMALIWTTGGAVYVATASSRRRAGLQPYGSNRPAWDDDRKFWRI